VKAGIRPVKTSVRNGGKYVKKYQNSCHDSWQTDRSKKFRRYLSPHFGGVFFQISPRFPPVSGVLQTCRPYGIWSGFAPLPYKHAVPTGLGRGLRHCPTNMPSLRDLVGVCAIFLQTCRPYGIWSGFAPLPYKHAAPTGLGRGLHHCPTNMPPLRDLVGVCAIFLQTCRPYGTWPADRKFLTEDKSKGEGVIH